MGWIESIPERVQKMNERKEEIVRKKGEDGGSPCREWQYRHLELGGEKKQAYSQSE